MVDGRKVERDIEDLPVNIKLSQLNAILLKIFLIVVFFVYYQTILIPGTLHGWVLVLGFTFTLPIVLQNFRNSHGKLPFDYTALGFLGLLYLLGFLANYSDALLENLQAYLLTLVCYVFVRENISTLPMTFLYSLLRYFLLCNGLLVILQFITGEFYPARYLAGDAPFQISSGFSDGPAKNGMLIAFALSFVFAKLLWAQARASFLDIVVFVVGAISLVLSASRAGLLSFCIAALLASIFSVAKRKQFRPNIKNAVVILFVFLTPLGVVLAGAFDFETLAGFRDPNIEKYGGNVVIYKLTVAEDDSSAERLGNIEHMLRMIANSPMQLFSVGFGLGSFISFNEGLNIHNSYFEVLFETGVYGFLAFVFLIVHVIRKALSRRDAAEVLPVLFALLSVMVFMAFHDVLRGRTFWIPLAILASFAYAKTEPKECPLGRSSGKLVH